MHHQHAPDWILNVADGVSNDKRNVYSDVRAPRPTLAVLATFSIFFAWLVSLLFWSRIASAILSSRFPLVGPFRWWWGRWKVSRKGGKSITFRFTAWLSRYFTLSATPLFGWAFAARVSRTHYHYLAGFFWFFFLSFNLESRLFKVKNPFTASFFSIHSK